MSVEMFFIFFFLFSFIRCSSLFSRFDGDVELFSLGFYLRLMVLLLQLVRWALFCGNITMDGVVSELVIVWMCVCVCEGVVWASELVSGCVKAKVPFFVI